MDSENKKFLEWLEQERSTQGVTKPAHLTRAQVEELEKLDIEDRLFVAILLNSEEIVDNLLKVGADPNATNKKGTTILQLALAFKRKEIAQLLLDYGAQPSVVHKPPKSKS